jgi:translation initiation factor IF-3
LEDGNKVKGTVFFRGREVTHSDLGEKLLMQLAKDLSDIGEAEGRPRMEGRTMHLMFGPSKKVKEKEKAPKKPAPAPSTALSAVEPQMEDAGAPLSDDAVN